MRDPMPPANGFLDQQANVLLVDDQPSNLLALQAILEGLGPTFAEARSGEEAITRLAKDNFAAVLLDVHMPGMDGFETAQIIRRQERSRHTPILFITAFEDNKESVEQGYALGAVDYLVKPVNPVVLRSKVAGYVDLFKQAQHARRQSELLRLLIEGTKDYAIFMLDPGGHILTWNLGAERIKGYKANEIIGQHFSRFYPPEDVKSGKLERELDQAIATGKYEEEGWRVRKDGSLFWASVVITALRDQTGVLQGFSKVTRDMTDRKRAEENARRLLQEEAARKAAEASALAAQLAEREERRQREQLRVTLHSIGDAVIATDTEARVTLLNPVAEELTGWRYAEARGQPLAKVFNIVNEATRKTVENPVNRVLREGTIVGLANHTVLVSRNGAETPIDDSAAPIRSEDGQLSGVILAFRDVTVRRAAERRRTARMAITQTLAQSATIEEAATGILQTICENLGWRLGGFWMLDQDTNKLQCLEVWQSSLNRETDFKSACPPFTFEKGIGLPGLVWSAFKPVWIPDAAAATELPRAGLLRKENLHGAFGCPISADANFLGVLEFFSDEVRQPDEDLLEMMATIGGQIGQFMDRRAAEEALRSNEERLRLAFEAGNMGSWDWNIQTNEVAWSPSLEAIHGLAPGAFPGTFEAYQRDLHPDDREAVLRSMKEAVETGKEHHLEYRLVWPDGSIHWIEARGKLYKDENGKPVRMAGVCSAIDERKRLENTLRFLAQASAAITALVDYESTLQKLAHLAVPFFADWCAVDVPDADGSIRRLAVAHVNPAKVEFAHLAHRRYPPDANALSGPSHVIRTGKAELVSEITDAMIAAAAKDPDHLKLLQDLGLKSYLCVPLVVQGKPLGAITFIAAESPRRYGPEDQAVAEDLAHRAADAIENARLYMEVKEADRRKDDFLAMLAHELRNPLAPVRNALQILRMRNADGVTVERAKDVMERQMEHLVRLVDDLLDVSRIMRDKIELRKERIELNKIVERAVETAQPLIDAQGHQLIVNLPSEPLWVEADSIRLSQVIANLLNNAAKYTEKAGRINLSAHQEGNEVVLQVKDNGIGIAPDMQTRIFDLFMQADRSIDRSQGGLGIGLTLVRRLVEMHHGRVTVASAGPGQGSEFTIRVPALAVLDGEGKMQSGKGDPAERAPSRRILIVDDNVDAAESLAMVLHLLKQQTRIVHDGTAALAAAREFSPDIILLDIGLPGMSGYEVAKHLRQQREFLETMLVAMTGYGQEDDRRRSQQAGFDHHLVKPVNLADLQKLIGEPRMAEPLEW
ncbi:MAG: PAS domain S-box protein [Gemmataceae bacterium]